jgi:Domain of unknown function (DUF4124)
MLDFSDARNHRKPTSVRVFPLAIVALLVAVTAPAAEVYRSVDPDGTVRYTDRPDRDNVETIIITTQRPSGAPRAAQPTASAPAPEAAPEPTEDTQPEPPPPTRRELAAERAANCSVARERNDRYQMSRRLYRTGADGEREYLSDAEIDAAKAGAADDVEKWCD